jgi:hypothetical protein
MDISPTAFIQGDLYSILKEPYLDVIDAKEICPVVYVGYKFIEKWLSAYDRDYWSLVEHEFYSVETNQHIKLTESDIRRGYVIVTKL